MFGSSEFIKHMLWPKLFVGVLAGLGVLAQAWVCLASQPALQDSSFEDSPVRDLKQTTELPKRLSQTDVPEIVVGNLVYAKGKSAECFSSGFLEDVNRDTHVRVQETLHTVQLAGAGLWDQPFAVISGEGRFTWTKQEKKAIVDYVNAGGFLVASAGCSDKKWAASFEKQIAEIFPSHPLETLPAEHPVFHTVYDIHEVIYKRGEPKLPVLEALTLDGRVVLVFSPDGLNDTDDAGGDCCCCGGNEIKSARQINVNLLVYALTR